MYDVEHKELFESLRQGQPINNSNYMVLSSMLAILAQMVCYTGEEITWEQAMTSTLDFSLPAYNWDAQATGETERRRHVPRAAARRDEVCVSRGSW